MGKNLDNIADTIRELIKKELSIQCTWVDVTEVDWNEKTMTAKGSSDGLEYYDILLGFGSEYRKPKVGCKCLIGTIDNKEAASYLIYAEEIEEYELTDVNGFKIHLKDGKLTINGDSLGGIVKAKELKSQVDKNTTILQQIQLAFSNWTPVSMDGGAALQLLSQQFTGLPRADLSGIENEKIKHG